MFTLEISKTHSKCQSRRKMHSVFILNYNKKECHTFNDNPKTKTHTEIWSQLLEMNFFNNSPTATTTTKFVFEWNKNG